MKRAAGAGPPQGAGREGFEASGYPGYRYAQPSKAELQQNAAKSRKRAQDRQQTLDPVRIEGRKIAQTWWGTAWCKNLESYADYGNRIARGRSYVRAGSVIDLTIERGRIRAQVQGSRSHPYQVDIGIEVIGPERAARILEQGGGRIENLEALVSGDFPSHLGEVFMNQKTGLFPRPDEIRFDCSCPDWASMCKHVAAVLYAIGSRLDRDPLMFFELRGIDREVFIQKSIDEKLEGMLKNAGNKSDRVLADGLLDDLFGVL